MMQTGAEDVLLGVDAQQAGTPGELFAQVERALLNLLYVA